jgi:hypothetical protein
MRRELRAKGHLPPAPRDKQALRVAERQAEEQAASARIAEAHEEAAHHEVEPKREERSRRRDFTVLLLLGLTAIAAIIFYLSQRAPSADDASTRPADSAAPAKGEAPR